MLLKESPSKAFFIPGNRRIDKLTIYPIKKSGKSPHFDFFSIFKS
ncbi:MAG: hypothetical protein JWO44_2362 [Bacteroidetes bacterium]|nr:hypothetical protein [Bacteroidota bacterium]